MRPIAIGMPQRYDQKQTIFMKHENRNTEQGTGDMRIEGMLANVGPVEMIARLKDEVARAPNSSKKLFDYANSLREIGRFSESIELYDRILSANISRNNKVAVLLNKGQALKDRGLLSEAEAIFRESCNFDDSTVSSVYLAAVLASQEKFVDAISVLEKSVNSEGDLDEVYLNMALSQRALGLLDDSVLSLTKALSISPDYARAEVLLEDIRKAAQISSNQ